MREDQEVELPEIVEAVSAVGGALAGTALTLVAGPFVGSASGEVVARVLARVGLELERRFLAPRQERRIGEAFQSAVDSTRDRLAAGEQPREDGFVEAGHSGGSSPADQLFEGVLLTAANEWEQRKVAYIGRIFAGLSFASDISPADASYLVRLAERLTYQQVVLLAFWQAAQDTGSTFHREVMSAIVRTAEGISRPTERSWPR